MDSIIKANNLSTGYNGRTVVKGVEFELKAGEIFSLVGPNGSGKSTLLKTIASQLEPIDGIAILDGKELPELSGKEIAQKISLMLTEHIKTDRMTCYDVVCAGRYPYTGKLGILSHKDKQKVIEAMEMVNISDLCNSDFNEISDGQRQRVLMARAICQEPQVIILDEPTGFLDIKYKLELLSVLKKLAKEKNMAVLLSLHELELAKRISDRVACIKNGRIEKIGYPKKILTEDYICHLYDLDKEDYRAYFGESDIYYHETMGKRLRCGFTTGTCAALAAAAATELLLTGSAPEMVRLITPKGIPVEVEPKEYICKDGISRCAVIKDAGDDIDATANIHIFADVERINKKGIFIEGGKGVGRVTRPGLEQPVGEAAINSMPRKMIREAVEKVCNAVGEEPNLKITISVPDGEEIAKNTFNPNLGIEGGISVIGTSGIVEPMSIQAIIETKKIELHQAALKSPTRIILTPGNYGLNFLKDSKLVEIEDIPIVVCSNFIGELLDSAAAEEIEQLLLVGHVGKLIKLAGGIMNTHSRWADCRTELFCAHAAICGADRELCQKLMGQTTTDACIGILMESGLWENVKDSLLNAMQRYLDNRTQGRFKVGAVIFSNVYGELGKTVAAEELIVQWSAEKGK